MSRDVKLRHRPDDSLWNAKGSSGPAESSQVVQRQIYILCESTRTVAATLNASLANDALSTQLLPMNDCLSGGFQTTQGALRGEQWTAGKIHDFLEKHL